VDIIKTDQLGPDLGALLSLQAQMAAGEWRLVSDAAQVIACYLVCHPAVARVRYPGLTSDEDYREASSTLRGGFGPQVDVLLADGAQLRVVASADDVKEQVMQLEVFLAKRK
jgi:cystathionine beta-lyase/cystathionine gamma-synthase